MEKNYKHLCLHIIASPFDGFYDMRRRNRANEKFVALMFFLYVALKILSYFFTGFIVNENDTSSFNTVRTLITTLFPFLLFVVANYSVTTLGDGKGFMKDIINVVGYSLFPLLICHSIALIISHFITTDTAVFYHILIVLGWILFAFYAFIGLIVIHEYGFFKGILYLLLTALAMAVIIFIIILLITLFQQLFGFGISIWREIIMRR